MNNAYMKLGSNLDDAIAIYNKFGSEIGFVGCAIKGNSMENIENAIKVNEESERDTEMFILYVTTTFEEIGVDDHGE